MNDTLFQPLPSDVRAALARGGSANIANCLLNRGLRNTFMVGLQPLIADQPPLIGPAFTLRFIPSREDLDTLAAYARDDNLHRRAIEECPAGAVLVLAPGGDSGVSVMGDMMALRLKARGVEGVVTDGGYRDTPGIRATRLPCFQRLASGPATPIRLHPVELNAPVGVAGVPVYAGDIVVGDAEGVVVIPRHLLEDVAREAAANADYEAFAAARISKGHSLFGLFPATAQSREEFARWVSAGRPAI